MGWDAEVAAEWERREHKIRGEIDTLRKDLDEKYKSQITWLNKSLEERQRYIVIIHEMPILGKWIRKYAERKHGQQETS